MSNNPWENDAIHADSAPWEKDAAAQSSASVPMSQAKTLPPTWSPTVNGKKVNAVYDPSEIGRASCRERV